MCSSDLIFSLYYKEYTSIIPFAITAALSITLSLLLKFIFRNSKVENLNDVKKSEGLFIVAASWILGGLIAALPYMFYGMCPIDALFESTSGITTTGASICGNIDFLPTFFQHYHHR